VGWVLLWCDGPVAEVPPPRHDIPVLIGAGIGELAGQLVAIRVDIRHRRLILRRRTSGLLAISGEDEVGPAAAGGEEQGGAQG
jgi:hypothetical protein